VGQQITLDIYAYGGRGPFRNQGVTEPSRPDFLAFAIEDNDGSDFQRLPIGDAIWVAQRVRQYALFPLRSGKLPIGAVEVLFGGDHYGGRRALSRSSAPLTVMVDEP